MSKTRKRRYPHYVKMIRNDPCVFCGTMEDKRTIDHIHPRSCGGPNTWNNYAPACLKCNQAKGHLTLLEFMLVGGTTKRQLNSHKGIGKRLLRDSKLPKMWFDPLRVMVKRDVCEPF